jgi:hypothetical protein
LDGTAGDDEYEHIGERYDEDGDGDGEPIDVYKVTNPTHKIVGNFNQMPFPSNHFDEAFGSCYLEGDDLTGEPNNLDELYRVMKPGGTVYLSGCPEYDYEGYYTGNTIQDLITLIATYVAAAARAGFSKIEVEDGETYAMTTEVDPDLSPDDPNYNRLIVGSPIIHLVK